MGLGTVAAPAAPAQNVLEEIFGGKKKPVRKKRPAQSSSKVKKQRSQASQDGDEDEKPVTKPSRSPVAASSSISEEKPAATPSPAAVAEESRPLAVEGRRKGTAATKKAASEPPPPTPSPTPAEESVPAKKSASSRAKPSPSPAPSAAGSKGRREATASSAPTPPPSSSLPGPAKGSGAAGAATAGAAAVPAGAGSSPAERPGAGTTSSITTDELREFSGQPERIQKLIEAALALTRRRLIYAYGSADPEKGGMDCSGTIYFLLRSQNFADVPRQANEQYVWVRKKSRISAVVSRRDDTFEINEMQPGDLLFWTGTYGVDRDPPVTHAMMYLGTSKKTGKRLMFGASNGRTYNGEKQNGVSVFDFKVSSAAARRGEAAPENAPDFVGYGPIPGLR